MAFLRMRDAEKDLKEVIIVTNKIKEFLISSLDQDTIYYRAVVRLISLRCKEIIDRERDFIFELYRQYPREEANRIYKKERPTPWDAIMR